MRKNHIYKVLAVLGCSVAIAATGCGSNTTGNVSAEKTDTAETEDSGSLSETQDETSQDEVDTVVYSGITTPTADGNYENAQAIGIKDGVICYVGDRDGVEDLIGDATEIVDYSDDYIVPGLIDGHCHAYVSGENMVCDFNLVDCKSVDEYVQKISDYVKENPKDFYIGYGWLDVYFENGQPTADILDQIDTDSPIYIKSEDCHSCWCNTAMMEKCNITKDTENPNGGVVEHYDNGEPSGCFRDTAMDVLIKPNVPVYTVDEYKDILLKAQDQYLSLGYSAYNDVIIDAGSIDNVVEAYHQLDEEGLLKAYVNVSCVVNNDENTLDNVQHIKELADETAGDHFQVTDIKFFMDGITESCTAYMKEAYKNDTENYGVDRWSGEEGTQRLYDAVTLCNDLGLTAHFHAIGDAAVSKALDAAEYAKENSKNPDIQNVMTHIQFITDADIQRFKDLNMIASCDFGWCYTESGEMTGDANYENIEFKNLGEDRVDSEQRYETMRKAGIPIAFATDYPATSNVDPFLCLEIGSARMYEGMQSTANNQQDECMSVQDELTAMTITTAHQLQRDDEIGSLEVGKKANFLVLDKDLLSIDTNDIYDSVGIVANYIDGVDVKTDDSADSSDSNGGTVAEKLVGTWTVKGVTGPEVYNTLNEGEEISTDDLSLEDASTAGLARYSFEFDGEGGGEYNIEGTDGSAAENVEISYTIQGASATHCDGIDVEISGGGGNRTLYYDSANDQMIVGYTPDDGEAYEYTLVLTREK